MKVLTSYGVPELLWWRERTDHIDITQGTAAFLQQVRQRASSYDAFIVRGSTGFSNRYVGQLSAAVAARHGLPTVLAECIWETTSRRFAVRKHASPSGADLPPPGKGTLGKLAISRLDHPRMLYCVLSEEERLPFAQRWGVPAERVVNTGYCATSLSEDAFPEQRFEVFAGGNSLRDYRALMEVAPALSAPVRIGTTLAPARDDRGLKIGWMPAEEFEERARSAAVVVVPLADGLERSAGQQTYLNAMLAGKPVVVTDVVGVREHITDGETGLLVPPNDAAALHTAVGSLLSDRELRQRIGSAARAHVLAHYTRDRYFARLLAVAQEFASD